MSYCPYCHRMATEIFSINARRYQACRECRLIFQKEQTERKTEKYLREYHDLYAIDQFEGGRLTLYDIILSEIEKRKISGRLLDVGTGCGFFPAMAMKRGWQAEGIDPSLPSVSLARSNGIKAFNGTLENYRNSEIFEVITFLNSLEHMASPWSDLKKAVKLLKPGGMIWIRFPNGLLHSWVYRMAVKMKISAAVRKFLVFHPYVFTPRFLFRLLRDTGFVDISIQNSRPAMGDPFQLFATRGFADAFKENVWKGADRISRLTCGKMLVGTSLNAIAYRPFAR